MTPPQATKSQFKSAGKPCGLPVIGWKHSPSGWYPEIPLKDGSVPPSSLARFLARAERQAKQHGYISGEYFANKSGEQKLAKAKKLCLTCRKIKVTGIRRYCEYCFRDRHRAAKRRYWNKRSSLDKTGFSALAAEALTELPNKSATVKAHTLRIAQNERGTENKPCFASRRTAWACRLTAMAVRIKRRFPKMEAP